MKVSETYKWEAEKQDGSIITTGAELNDCIRFSLIPKQGLLPRHDIIGISMIRRFGRGFLKQMFQSTTWLPGFQYWENGSNIIKTEENLMHLVSPGRLIKKRHDGEKWWVAVEVKEDQIVLAQPYDGRTKRIESILYVAPPKPEYLHCVVCKDFRLYVRSSDGTILLTPADYELYL